MRLRKHRKKKEELPAQVPLLLPLPLRPPVEREKPEPETKPHDPKVDFYI